MRAICELAGGKESQSDPYYQKVANTNIFLTTRKTKFFPGTFRKLVPGPSKTFSRTHWNFFPDLKIYFLGQNQPPGILYNVATWWSHPELPWQFFFFLWGNGVFFLPVLSLCLSPCKEMIQNKTLEWNRNCNNLVVFNKFWPKSTEKKIFLIFLK